MMLILALLTGFGIGTLAWFLTSHWVAVWINHVEDSRPELVRSRTLQVYEFLACGFVFPACLGLALWLSRVFWLQWTSNRFSNSLFSSFPVGPFGMSSTNEIDFGHLKSARRSLQKSINSFSEASHPSRKITNARTSSP